MKARSYRSIIFLGLTLLIAPLVVQAQSAPVVRSGLTRFSVSMLLIVVVGGVLYNLWLTTKAYGGIVGQGLRRVGVGIVIFSIEALDRVAVNMGADGIVGSLVSWRFQSITHDTLFLLGLFFIILGFKRLISVSKT